MELFQFGKRKIRKNTIFLYTKKYYQPNLIKGAGGFVTLQNVFLGLDRLRCEHIAARIVAEMVDIDMLPAAQVPADTAQKVQQVSCVLNQGIKVGTDAYKSDTETCRHAQLTRQIRILFHEQDTSLMMPYGKSFARHLAGAGPGPELIAQKRAQL